MRDFNQEQRAKAFILAAGIAAIVVAIGYLLFGVLEYKPALVIGGIALLTSYFL